MKTNWRHIGIAFLLGAVVGMLWGYATWHLWGFFVREVPR